MELKSEEVWGGKKWFICAGTVAVIFAYALFQADQYLTKSPRERELGQTLHDLRTAQSSLPTGVTDKRQLDHSVLESHTEQAGE